VYESEEGGTDTQIIGAGSWDSEVLNWDWRVNHRLDVAGRGWQSGSSFSYQVGLKGDAIAGSAGTIEWARPYRTLLLHKTSESLEDTIVEIQTILKGKLPFWPESGFSGLPSLVAQKVEEQEQLASAAAKAQEVADAEKAAAEAKKKKEMSKKVSGLESKFPELGLLFQQAHQAGLTDAKAINTMWLNIASGRFTAEHYLDMWKQRLEPCGVKWHGVKQPPGPCN